MDFPETGFWWDTQIGHQFLVWRSHVAEKCLTLNPLFSIIWMVSILCHCCAQFGLHSLSSITMTWTWLLLLFDRTNIAVNFHLIEAEYNISSKLLNRLAWWFKILLLISRNPGETVNCLRRRLMVASLAREYFSTSLAKPRALNDVQANVTALVISSDDQLMQRNFADLQKICCQIC